MTWFVKWVGLGLVLGGWGLGLLFGVCLLLDFVGLGLCLNLGVMCLSSCCVVGFGIWVGVWFGFVVLACGFVCLWVCLGLVVVVSVGLLLVFYLTEFCWVVGLVVGFYGYFVGVVVVLVFAGCLGFVCVGLGFVGGLGGLGFWVGCIGLGFVVLSWIVWWLLFILVIARGWFVWCLVVIVV